MPLVLWQVWCVLSLALYLQLYLQLSLALYLCSLWPSIVLSSSTLVQPQYPPGGSSIVPLQEQTEGCPKIARVASHDSYIWIVAEHNMSQQSWQHWCITMNSSNKLGQQDDASSLSFCNYRVFCFTGGSHKSKFWCHGWPVIQVSCQHHILPTVKIDLPWVDDGLISALHDDLTSSSSTRRPCVCVLIPGYDCNSLRASMSQR